MRAAEEARHLVLDFPILPLELLGWLDRLQQKFPGSESGDIVAHPLGMMRIRITVPSEAALHFALTAIELAGWTIFAKSEL